MVTPAKQVLTTKGPRKFAVCPEHNIQSSDFRAAQVDIYDQIWWVFRCKGKDGHLFNAAPDPSAPTGVADYQAWVERQRAAQRQ